MLYQGRVLCNGCSCSMGTIHVPSSQAVHFCPDCSASSVPPVDVLTPRLLDAMCQLLRASIRNGRLPGVIR